MLSRNDVKKLIWFEHSAYQRQEIKVIMGSLGEIWCNWFNVSDQLFEDLNQNRDNGIVSKSRPRRLWCFENGIAHTMSDTLACAVTERSWRLSSQRVDSQRREEEKGEKCRKAKDWCRRVQRDKLSEWLRITVTPSIAFISQHRYGTPLDPLTKNWGDILYWNSLIN